MQVQLGLCVGIHANMGTKSKKRMCGHSGLCMYFSPFARPYVGYIHRYSIYIYIYIYTPCIPYWPYTPYIYISHMTSLPYIPYTYIYIHMLYMRLLCVGSGAEVQALLRAQRPSDRGAPRHVSNHRLEGTGQEVRTF